jgi:plasmid maintenance system antidote protein VapI
MATRSTRLADGQPVKQAVPEDYSLAAILINALTTKNDNEIEFVLKTYLPIRVVPSTLSSGCFLIEYRGMSSASLVSHQETNFGDLLDRVRGSHSSSELLDCISDCLSVVDIVSGAISQEHLGVLSGPLAACVSQMLEWPTKERLEEYALSLPKLLKDSDVEKCAEALQETFRVLRNAGAALSRVDEGIASQMRNIVSEKESQTSTKIARLNQRIDVLRKEVANLQSRIEQMTARDSSTSKRSSKRREIETTLKSRNKALKRDIARREEILTRNQEAFRDLLVQQKELHSRTKSAQSRIENQRRLLHETFLVACSGVCPDEDGATLMIPFIMIGFSKKGRLRVVVYPPSYLPSIDQQVGRRRDYVYPLTADSGLSPITDELTRRANNDVGFRNFLRTSSKKNNLLAIGVSRSLIKEGGKSLQSDGLVKANLLDEISSIISGFPESKKKPMKLSKVSPLLSGTDATCFVRFHVHDDSGKPIEGALLELGAFLLQSDHCPRAAMRE